MSVGGHTGLTLTEKTLAHASGMDDARALAKPDKWSHHASFWTAMCIGVLHTQVYCFI